MLTEKFPSEVTAILRDLQRIPYENLSKIVAWSRDKDWLKVLDTPEKLHKKSTALGAGATCFSLTYFLYRQMKEQGFETEFLMADKYNFKNIHCGLLFRFEGTEYLLDPGYMLYYPMPVPKADLSIHFPFVPNEICLENMESRAILRLYTGKKGNLKFRFDFNRQPVDLELYFRYWKNSFYYDMMEYPVLNRLVGETQHYIQKRNYLKRTAEGSEFIRLNPDSFAPTVKEVFGLSEDLIEESVQVLLQKSPDLF